jgi:5'(3')-deoxyribonucleotidase
MRQNSDNENIALVDMDGTLANYDLAMERDLESLRAPCEEPYTTGLHKKHPPHIVARMDMIKSNGDWWENLPKLKMGFDILEILLSYGFYISILTQGPKTNPVAWEHKVRWCKKNVPDLDITITRNKGLVYGKVLVDDYPAYIKQWLKWRPRGVVIMPGHPWNRDFSFPNVFRYDGHNLEAVKSLLRKVRDRKAGESFST